MSGGHANHNDAHMNKDVCLSKRRFSGSPILIEMEKKPLPEEWRQKSLTPHTSVHFCFECGRNIWCVPPTHLYSLFINFYVRDRHWGTKVN